MGARRFFHKVQLNHFNTKSLFLSPEPLSSSKSSLILSNTWGTNELLNALTIKHWI